MPILHVRNVPARLYGEIRRLAERHHRSLSAEILSLLEEEVRREAARAEQARILDDLDRVRRSMPALPRGVDSADWIREERDRHDP